MTQYDIFPFLTQKYSNINNFFICKIQSLVLHHCSVITSMQLYYSTLHWDTCYIIGRCVSHFFCNLNHKQFVQVPLLIMKEHVLMPICMLMAIWVWHISILLDFQNVIKKLRDLDECKLYAVLKNVIFSAWLLNIKSMSILLTTIYRVQ
jgi:hypothetical protein